MDLHKSPLSLAICNSTKKQVELKIKNMLLETTHYILETAIIVNIGNLRGVKSRSYKISEQWFYWHENGYEQWG